MERGSFAVDDVDNTFRGWSCIMYLFSDMSSSSIFGVITSSNSSKNLLFRSTLEPEPLVNVVDVSFRGSGSGLLLLEVESFVVVVESSFLD